MIRRRIMAAVLSLLVAAFVALPFRTTATNSDDPAVVEWIRSHAVSLQTPEAGHGFADMQPLKKMIGNARIVSLGEATHGTREFFQLKHRMMEFLATEMGFTIFTIEANMPEAYRLNDYVLNGNGDPAELIKGMYFWTWDTQEVLEMVKWMREFNKSGKGRVEFTGFDMQTPDVAANTVQDFVKKNDSAFVETVRKASELAKFAQENRGQTFGVATANFPIQDAAGKKIHYSGYIKTENINRGYAGLWWRIDGASGMLSLDNMHDRGATGTTDWKRYDIDVSVPIDAKHVFFGVIQAGDGTAWFDGLTIDVDGKHYTDMSAFDLDFESSPLKGFRTGGTTYRTGLDDAVFHNGKQSLRMQYLAPPPDPTKFGVAVGTFPVKDAIGKRVKFSGYIKTEGITQGFAGLWWRIDGPSGIEGFDNMDDRGVTGTTDWKRYDVELAVPTDALGINFGAILPANGTAWFDSLSIEIDGVRYQADENLNLDFESPLLDNQAKTHYPPDSPLGFHAGGTDYDAQLVKDIFHTGKQSLRLKYAGASPGPVDPTLAVSTWQSVLRHLEESRDAYATKGVSTRDLQWIIQNARVVTQCMQMRAGEVSRDRSMAENIKWIADHNPKAKIVVWAHNGHVATAGPGGFDPMGSSLRKMFGAEMVVFGFAFNQGSFQSVEPGKGLHDFTVPAAPQGSLDATLAATGIPLFALDLRAAPKTGPVATWLSEPHQTRSIGAVYSQDNASQYFVEMVASQFFDCLLFVEKTTAARKNL